MLAVDVIWVDYSRRLRLETPALMRGLGWVRDSWAVCHTGGPTLPPLLSRRQQPGRQHGLKPRLRESETVDLVELDADEGSAEARPQVFAAARNGVGAAADLEHPRLPRIDRFQVIDDDRRPWVRLHVAELLGGGDVEAARHLSTGFNGG